MGRGAPKTTELTFISVGLGDGNLYLGGQWGTLHHIFNRDFPEKYGYPVACLSSHDYCEYMYEARV